MLGLLHVNVTSLLPYIIVVPPLIVGLSRATGVHVEVCPCITSWLPFWYPTPHALQYASFTFATCVFSSQDILHASALVDPGSEWYPAEHGVIPWSSNEL